MVVVRTAEAHTDIRSIIRSVSIEPRAVVVEALAVPALVILIRLARLVSDIEGRYYRKCKMVMG
jgi:hypothetical protein